MWNEHHRNRLQIIILLGAAFLIRLAAGWLAGQAPVSAPLEYEWIARNILSGRGFVYDHLNTPYLAFVPPAYPVFCAAVYGATKNSQLVLLLLQCLISALTCLQVTAIGQLLLNNRKTALWGGWLTAIHPGMVIYATKLHPMTTDLFVYLWALWAWLTLYRKPTWRRAIVAGLASGTALLSRGTIAYFTLFAAVFYILRFRGSAAMLRKLMPALILSALLVMPWLIRNAVHFGRFPLYMTTSGELLWRGNNPAASGSALRPDGTSVLSAAPEPFRKELLTLGELDQNRLFFETAKRFIIENPVWALKLYAKKWVAFWTFSPQTGLWYPKSYVFIYYPFYLLTILLATAGAWAHRHRLRTPEGILLAGFILSICMTQSIFYVEGRHRWTVEPLLLAAAGLLTMLRRPSTVMEPES
ncbi:MAG: glycosyltransferase family 39 protein [Candidatus Omnitrophica bacterium]|nr:glycosyltransferase family 39 protein [Candidatus Omnitrophota bacterium]